MTFQKHAHMNTRTTQSYPLGRHINTFYTVLAILSLLDPGLVLSMDCSKAQPSGYCLAGKALQEKQQTTPLSQPA